MTTPSTARYRKLSPGPGSPASQVAADQRTRIQSAMIELVGEDGYEAVSVRRLAALAGVSTRTFYSHFEGKEECFLRTYELVVERIGARVVSAQAGEQDWSRGLGLALQGIAGELVNKPRAARLALLEIFDAGPAAHDAMARAEARFEEMLTESSVRPPNQGELSPLLAKAIVSGVTFVARTRLLGASPAAGAEVAGELSQWVLSLRDTTASDQPSVSTPSDPSLSPPRSEPGEREIILTATAKLAATNGYWQLTVPRILAAAGLRKKSFTSNFTGVEDCFLAVLEQRTAGLLGRAMTGSTEDLPWPNRVHRVIESLCAGIAADPLTAKLVFLEARSAGQTAVARQDALLRNLATELLHDAPKHDGKSTPSIYAEASLGAIWGIVRSYVASGRESQLPKFPQHWHPSS
jgi:AcrR family transcriptional regulator